MVDHEQETLYKRSGSVGMVDDRIYCGDAREIMAALPSNSISMLITSPPYWNLRDYSKDPKTKEQVVPPMIWDADPDCDHVWNTHVQPKERGSITGDWDRPSRSENATARPRTSHYCTKCGAWRGHLGLEPKVEDFVRHLADCFDEAKRVLREDGTLWVNIGDTHYNAGPRGNVYDAKQMYVLEADGYVMDRPRIPYERKCLLMVPERFAIEMISRGWVLRNVLIWHKPNAVPQSMRDRFTHDFEYIYLFAVSNKPLYWSNPVTGTITKDKPPGTHGKEGIDWYWFTSKSGKRRKRTYWSSHSYYFEQQFEEFESVKKNRAHDIKRLSTGRHLYEGKGTVTLGRDSFISGHAVGRNKRAVWEIPTASFKGAHFAVFPPQLLETPIRAGCPLHICKKCGLPRIWIYRGRSIDTEGWAPAKKDFTGDMGGSQKWIRDGVARAGIPVKDLMVYAKCECDAGFDSGIVADLFFGAGTTGYVAKQLRRRYVGIELNPKYIKIAEKRIAEVEPLPLEDVEAPPSRSELFDVVEAYGEATNGDLEEDSASEQAILKEFF